MDQASSIDSSSGCTDEVWETLTCGKCRLKTPPTLSAVHIPSIGWDAGKFQSGSTAQHWIFPSISVTPSPPEQLDRWHATDQTHERINQTAKKYLAPRNWPSLTKIWIESLKSLAEAADRKVNTLAITTHSLAREWFGIAQRKDNTNS